MKIRYFLTIILVFILFYSVVYAQNPNWKYRGKLDRIQKNNVIITDQQFKLDQFVKFRAISDKPVSRADFKKGSDVVPTFNKKREIIILWLVDKQLP